MNKKYKSEAMMVTHQAMKDLFDAGIIDAARMREFDAKCLMSEAPATATTSSGSSPKSEKSAPAFASKS
jgi:DNA-binding transcriptional regulator YiaG